MRTPFSLLLLLIATLSPVSGAMVSAWVVGLLWFALLGGGPTMRKWMLTGQHRYRPLGGSVQTSSP
jgi:hypothetical protein